MTDLSHSEVKKLNRRGESIKRAVDRKRTDYSDRFHQRKRKLLPEDMEKLAKMEERAHVLDATTIEYLSHVKLVAAEIADKNYKQRELRIRVGIANDPIVQKILSAPREKTPAQILINARKHIAGDKHAVTVINHAFDVLTGARKQ